MRGEELVMGTAGEWENETLHDETVEADDAMQCVLRREIRSLTSRPSKSSFTVPSVANAERLSPF